MANQTDFVPCIDIGHGGSETGAVGSGLVEKELNLEVGKRLSASFVGTSIVPVVTRSGDYDPKWEARYRTAKTAETDFVISIHFNANQSLDVNGGEAYYWPGNDYTMSAGFAFLNALPIELRRSKLFEANGENRWFKRARTVLGAFKEIPCLLAECGYLTNPSDSEYIKCTWAIDAIVSALRCSIVRAAHLKEIRSVGNNTGNERGAEQGPGK